MKEKLKRISIFLLTVTLYALFGYLLLTNIYLAIYFIATFLGMLFGRGVVKEYCTNVWFQIDVLAGSVFHFRKKRTVSGITGERAIKNRYGAGIMEKFINLFFLDTPDHCRKTYYKELKLLEFEKSLLNK